VTDTKGRPLEVLATIGQQHDSTMALSLMDFIQGGACLADMAYDSNEIVAELNHRRLKVVIPPTTARKKKRRYDKVLYRLRYLVECFFHDLKRFRRIATRYDKTVTSYLGFVHLASALKWIQ